MDKHILIEIFKNKLCHDNVILKNYNYSCAIDFYYDKDLVDVRIFEKSAKYYIQYETVSFVITKSEYEELFLLYDEKKKLIDKIEEEKERQTHIRHTNSILEMYQQIICQKRKVLTEKTQINI